MIIANLGNGEVDQEDSSPSPGGAARDPPLLLLTDFPIGDDLSHWGVELMGGLRKSPLGWKPMKGKLHGLSAARIVYRSLWPVADLTLIGVAPSGVSCNKWTQHGKVLGRVEGNWIEICLILNVPRVLASFEWGRWPPIAPVMILTQRLRMQENNLTMSEAKPGHCAKSQRNHGCIWLSFVKQRLTQIRP